MVANSLGCSPLSALPAPAPSLTYIPSTCCPLPGINQLPLRAINYAVGWAQHLWQHRPRLSQLLGLLTTRQLGLEARWLVAHPFTRSPTQNQPGNCLHCHLQHWTLQLKLSSFNANGTPNTMQCIQCDYGTLGRRDRRADRWYMAWPSKYARLPPSALGGPRFGTKVEVPPAPRRTLSPLHYHYLLPRPLSPYYGGCKTIVAARVACGFHVSSCLRARRVCWACSRTSRGLTN